MPAYFRQSITVISERRKSKPTLLITRKTGYQNIIVNGIPFFYNLTQAFKDPNDIDFDEIANYQNTTGKKVIVVKRK